MPETRRPIVAIGAGAIVKHAHWPAYRLAGFQIASVYDRDPMAARELADEYGVACFDSLAKLVEEAPKDCVFDVAVPAIAIREVLWALPNGSAVLVQKPLGENLEQAGEIERICADKRLRMAVNFQLRFAPYCLAAVDLISKGFVGEISEIEVRVNVDTPWHLWPFLKEAPRMEIVYHSIHYLDFIRSVLGEPLGVMAKTIKHRDCPELDSARSAIFLDYGQFQRATVYTNHGHRFGPKHQASMIRIEGDKGCIVIQMGLNLNYPAGGEDRLEFALRKEDFWARVPLEGSWFPQAFIGTMSTLMCSLDDSQFLVPTRLSDAMKTMELVERCYQSNALKAL